MPAVNLQPIYDELGALLRRHAKPFVETDHWEGSQAKTKKPTLLLVCKEKVSINGRPPQAMMFAGAMLQKNYVAFHFLPIYGAPKLFKLSPRLKKLLKGKACFQIKAWDAELRQELDALLTQGASAFRKLGWLKK